MRDRGFLSRVQRRLAWGTVLLLTFYAPVAALLVPDATWVLTVTVAALVGVVIVVDDGERRRGPATGGANKW